MKDIPPTKNALVLRTDFSDDKAWESICAAIEKPVGEFQAYVDFISDPDFDQVTIEQILSSNSPSSHRSFLFVVDRLALSHPDQPVLVVDLYKARGRTFRVVPCEIWGVENNLSLANMDFADFADCAGDDGVFRGFP